jgi:hypothetical protein
MDGMGKRHERLPEDAVPVLTAQDMRLIGFNITPPGGSGWT